MRTALLLVLVALSAAAQPTLPPGFPTPKPPPPAIQRLLDKQNDGAELSAAEQKAVDTWQAQRVQEMQQALFKSVQQTPLAAAAADQAGVFACPAVRATPAQAPPTRPQFLKLLDELKREHTKKAGERVAAVDRALATARTDAAGTNMALPLTLAGSASAAVVAAVWSCARKPDNATFASNLGSLLDGVDDARAPAALAYALALGPDNVLPNVNSGWYLFNRGQLVKAQGAFERASKRGAGLGPVLLGQGLVAHCQGDHRRAVELLTRALSVSSSPAGEQALSTSRSRDDESQAEDDPENRNRPPPPTPGAVPTPRRDDWTADARKPRVAFAEPIVSGTNEEHLQVGMGKNAAIVEGYRRAAEALIARQQGLEPNAGRDRAPTQTATSMTFYRGDDAMAELARAQYTAYAARVRAVRAPFERDFEAQKVRTGARLKAILEAAQAEDPARAPAIYCANARQYLDGEYVKFKALWRGSWEAEQRVVREYGETAGATISRIRHDDLRTYVDLERQLHLTTMAMDGPADVSAWGVIGGAIMICDKGGGPPSRKDTAPQEDAKKAPCPSFLQNGIGVSLGVASISLDCEKLTVQAGEGIIGRFEQNYVKHEQTYFLGVGVEATAGVGPVSAGLSGSAGVFVTCSGNTVRDVGVTGSSGASVPGFAMETTGSTAVVGGPRGSFSAGVNVGVDVRGE